MPTRTLSIVFTDIKGFTARTASSSRAELRDLLDRHEELLLPVIHHYDGTVVKTIGDAFLLTFESPTNAVLCGLMIQDTLREFNLATVEAEQIEVRVAINTGEVEVRGSDVFGETVNIAARIEGITEAGEVYFTHATYLSMNKSEVPTSEVGERRLKGIDEPIRVYRVIRDEGLARYQTLIASEREGRAQSLLEKPTFAVKPARSNKTKFGLALALGALLLAGIFGPNLYTQFQVNRSIENLQAQIADASNKSSRDEAFEELNAIAKNNADNNKLLHRIALINGADPYWKRSAFQQIAALVSRDKAYVNDQALSDILFSSLGYLDIAKTDAASKDGKLRTLIAEKYAEKWRDKLLAMVHELGVAERIERRNAYLVLEQSPLEDELVRLRYFTIELWGDVDSGNLWNARTFDYLDTQVSEQAQGAGSHWTPSEQLPKFLQYFNDEAARVVSIVSNLYVNTLQATLLAAVVSEDLGYRLHSKKILEQQGWFTSALERDYQLANLNSYWKDYTSPWVVDSVVYFGQQDRSSVDAEVLTVLRKISVETAAIIASGEVPDKRQDMKDYQSRLDATVDALAALKE
jgi:class 3 adenylate cyclase